MPTETKVIAETLSLIDTDILSYILKRKEPAYQNSHKYLNKFGCFKISCITYYECLRGYKASGATTRLKLFQDLLQITEAIYPKPEYIRLSFQRSTLALYQGKVRLRGKLLSQMPGALSVRVQFQACDDKRCLPPEDMVFKVP